MSISKTFTTSASVTVIDKNHLDDVGKVKLMLTKTLGFAPSHTMDLEQYAKARGARWYAPRRWQHGSRKYRQGEFFYNVVKNHFICIAVLHPANRQKDARLAVLVSRLEKPQQIFNGDSLLSSFAVGDRSHPVIVTLNRYMPEKYEKYLKSLKRRNSHPAKKTSVKAHVKEAILELTQDIRVKDKPKIPSPSIAVAREQSLFPRPLC